MAHTHTLAPAPLDSPSYALVSLIFDPHVFNSLDFDNTPYGYISP